MEKQGHFIQEPFRTFGSLDDDALCIVMQPPLIFVSQIPAGMDDHRNTSLRIKFFQFLQQLERTHVGKSQVKHDAVELLAGKKLNGFSAAVCNNNSHIPLFQQGNHCLGLILVILNNQQHFHGLFDSVFQCSENSVQLFTADRFGDVTDGSHAHRLLTLLQTGDKMHRDMPRYRIVLQAAHYSPTIDMRKHDIKYDRVGLKALGKGDSALTIGSHQSGETAIMYHVGQHRGKGKIILNDQDTLAVARNKFAVVRDRRRKWIKGFAYRYCCIFCDRNEGTALMNRNDRLILHLLDSAFTFDRKIQGEGTSLPCFACQRYFPTHGAGKLARDGKTQACTAIGTAGAAVSLLEGIKDMLLFVYWNTDSGVGNGKGYCSSVERILVGIRCIGAQ